MAYSQNYDKHKHLIGTEVNGWQILDIKVYDDVHHTYALAQCRCGNTAEIRLTKILTGRTLDCGCGHQKRLQEAIIKKYQDIIGSEINGWTILEIIPSDNSNVHTRAICQCQCGTIKEVRLSYVRQGRSKDCGCGRKAMLRETLTKNIIGQRFGKLVAVELLEESNKFKRRLYRCKCDCGNETVVPSNSLIAGHTQSCGCLNSQYNMRIHLYLEERGINHQTEYGVQVDGRHLRFDFYLPNYNLLIEYDGEQHFRPVAFNGDKELAVERFKMGQERDAIKNKYCEDNQINLLRIPYWESENIETIISNHLQRLSERDFVA